jgi:hypothetical protein
MNTRICKVCEIEKPLSSFSKRRASKTDKRLYHRHQCNTCMSRQNKARPKGRETVRRIAKSCKQKYRQRVPEMKLQLFKDIEQTQCKHCGINNPIVLCFHHRDKKEKSFGIAWAFTHSYAYETILREAKKCDVLCANCHLILHATEEDHASSQSPNLPDETYQPGP